MVLHLKPSPNRVAGDLEEPDTPSASFSEVEPRSDGPRETAAGAVERITVNSLAESSFSLVASYFFVEIRACR